MGGWGIKRQRPHCSENIELAIYGGATDGQWGEATQPVNMFIYELLREEKDRKKKKKTWRKA